ncbi:ABC transporter ATP-binding protein [Bryobacter aggregatus]|uniref:ABC transporter ATP-binding protein n=1 Tax=Bryobacter aggregatus TaxID=360054 RepID=UPI0004E15D95|nr:ABC transporter ATP-binding protein [Bryobacter aggregatus]
MADTQTIVFEDVSRFYGEVLGVNRVNLTIPPGITSLVGPNGSGKTTLMNMMTGLVRPSKGRITVCGLAPDQPEKLFRILGYCTQFDSFPRGYTGFQFVNASLLLQGMPAAEAEAKAWKAIEKVNLVDAAPRKVAAYSKGMRQRIRLAQSIAHDPQVLILDEPLNGLDPLVRSETIALFREQAERGAHVIVSSHVLHEVDMISDQVILLANGYVVAEGAIRGVREEISDRPHQIIIRCDKPSFLASKLFEQDYIVEVRIHQDRQGLLVKTTDAARFHKLLNHLVLGGIHVETIAPADDDVNSLYEYLIGDEGGH